MKRLPILLGLILLSGAAVASAAIKGSKSNSSDKMVCRDLACCKANPKAMTSNGQPCSAILSKSKNSGHASEKQVDKPSPKLLREGSPVTPTPNEQKGRGLGIAAHKEEQPATPAITPTPKPAEGASKFGRDKLKGITKVAATPTPTPAKK